MYVASEELWQAADGSIVTAAEAADLNAQQHRNAPPAAKKLLACGACISDAEAVRVGLIKPEPAPLPVQEIAEPEPESEEEVTWH